MASEPPAESGVGDTFIPFSATHDGENTVWVRGDIDVATAPELQQVLFAAMNTLIGSQLRIDFSAVTFIDSTGLAALVAARNLGKASGKTVLLVQAPKRVIRLLQITGLADIFLGPNSATSTSPGTDIVEP